MNRPLPSQSWRQIATVAYLLTATAGYAIAGSVQPNCLQQDFAVELDTFGTSNLNADVCGLETATVPLTVQILLHGGAYNRQYWHPPIDEPQYSYVIEATKRGYITVNLDRLGYGSSDRPDGNLLTFELGAEAVSAVVNEIAAGGLGAEVDMIVLNGHSMGGIVGELVAASNANVSALIVSGLANTPDGSDDDEVGGGPPTGGNPFIPATDDEKFAENPSVGAYMTTAPGVRAMLFHAPGTTEDRMTLLDNEIRDTIANAELRSVMSGQADRPSFSGQSVYYLGQHDRIACEGQDCTERFKGTDWHVVIPGAGHSINLSKSAPTFFAETFQWLEEIGLAPDAP